MMSSAVRSHPSLKGWLLQSRLAQLASTLPPGARLPSERELSSAWGVARMTLRKAVDHLVDEGKLERRPGSGTYAVQPTIIRTLGLSSFSEDMRARGKVPGTLTIDIHRGPADASVAQNLGVAIGEPVVAFTRLRLADDEPVAVECSWILERLVPGFGLDGLDDSLYEYLRSRHGLAPTRATTVIAAAAVSDDEAVLLDVAPGEPCLRITMVDFTEDEPFMLAICSYRADRYQLQAELTHGAGSNTAGSTGSAR